MLPNFEPFYNNIWRGGKPSKLSISVKTFQNMRPGGVRFSQIMLMVDPLFDETIYSKINVIDIGQIDIVQLLRVRKLFNET